MQVVWPISGMHQMHPMLLDLGNRINMLAQAGRLEPSQQPTPSICHPILPEGSSLGYVKHSYVVSLGRYWQAG